MYAYLVVKGIQENIEHATLPTGWIAGGGGPGTQGNYEPGTFRCGVHLRPPRHSNRRSHRLRNPKASMRDSRPQRTCFED